MTDYLHDRLVAAVGDHFLIESELGRGGMGAVYRALDVRLNRPVAIKVLPPDLAFNPSVRSRFLREAQMAAMLMHPNIVPIYTVDERDSLVYFVMALVEGESLAARLAGRQPLPITDVRRIVGAVADALGYAHGQGVVHRDIKPDNILLDRATGRPMVTDFGIARAAAEQSRLTVTGVAVGTPAYMSPEQAMGERDVDGRSDIYSLGVVAYQMVAGETPFKATNTPAMLMKHVSEPPAPLRQRRADVPADVAAAIERALAKRPESRFSSAAELRDAMLHGTAGSLSAEARQIPQPEPHPEPAAHHFPAAVAGLPASAPPAVGLPWLHLPPPGLSRSEKRRWYRDQRRELRDAARAAMAARPEPSTEEKIARFRRHLATYIGVNLLLFGINAATAGFPWFIFPALGMMVPLARQLGSLWADGASLKQIFAGREGTVPPRIAALSGPPEDEPAAEVLNGPHGDVLRHASLNRRSIVELLAKASPREREMLPADIDATVAALFQRIVAVATTLHRLDEDAGRSTLDSLDGRLVTLRAETATPERDRRIALLERQRSTVADLRERRSALIAQVDSASLALENLKLDLVRFRSAGITSAFEDVTSATREARAVSRDIGHLLDAADDVRRM